MRLTRFVPTLGLCLALAMFGCGSGAQQVDPAARDEDRLQNINKGLREMHKKQRESAKANSLDRKSGRPRVRPGT